MVFKRLHLSKLLSGWPAGGQLPGLLQDHVIIIAPQQCHLAQEAFARGLSATSWRTACPKLQLRCSLPHICCEPVTSLSCYYLTNMVLRCTMSPCLALIFCFHRNILTLLANADFHYDNDENYLGMYNSFNLPGLFRHYISRLWYSLWAHLRWVSASISQNPTASRSRLGARRDKHCGREFKVLVF